MSERPQQVHLLAVAAEMVQYHVVHPTDPDQDEWIREYPKALAICAQFVRDYGAVHLHAETHRAGHYLAECLVRQGMGGLR